MREVARGIAEKLGFALVDEEIVLEAAAGAGVEPAVVADVERRRSFIERAILGLGTNVAVRPGLDPGAFAHAGGLAGAGEPADVELRDLIRIAIEEAAGRGDVVIVAHAASHALASQPDVLRVLVTASQPIRQARVAAERELGERDAARAVDQSDTARADYLKRFYGTKTELSTQYDLVVNTDRISPPEAVSLVALAAGR